MERVVSYMTTSDPSPFGPSPPHTRDSVRDDGLSFVSFYQAEHDGQVRRAFLLLGRSAMAHDVVAEAFIAVFRRWQVIEEPGPYLNRCVLNGCRDASTLGCRPGTVGSLIHRGLAALRSSLQA